MPGQGKLGPGQALTSFPCIPNVPCTSLVEGSLPGRNKSIWVFKGFYILQGLLYLNSGSVVSTILSGILFARFSTSERINNG